MSPWAVAFLAQARSDFAAAEKLLPAVDQASQATMLLQMAWEKLAKAALANTVNFDPKSVSHRVVEKFAGVLIRKSSAVGRAFKLSPLQANKRLIWLRTEIAALEALVPVKGGGENAEYPWRARDAAGSEVIRWPAAHLPRRFCQPTARGGHLWHDFRAIASNFERIFA